jgi:hypothetical protein
LDVDKTLNKIVSLLRGVFVVDFQSNNALLFQVRKSTQTELNWSTNQKSTMKTWKNESKNLEINGKWMD